MNVIVNVVGLEALKKVLKEKIEKVNGNVEKAVVKATLKVEADAKKKAPVLDGRLRSSITHEIKKVGKEYIARVGTNVKYAPYLEFGTGIHSKLGTGRKTKWVYFNEKLKKFFTTRGGKPHPYLYPALQQNFKFIKDTIPGAVLEGFKK